MRSLVSIFLLLVFAPGTPDRAFAQGGIGSLIEGGTDSLATAEPDSLLPPWWTPLVPGIDASVEADVSSVEFKGGIEAPVGEFGPGMGGRARFSASDESYRQFERDKQTTKFTLDLDGSASRFGDFDLSAERSTSRDENRVTFGSAGALVLEHEYREVEAKLVGRRQLGKGMRATWGLLGGIEDFEGSDKGIDNDRTLAGAGFSGLWGARGERHDITARYGYHRRSGDRVLRGQSSDALAERDTLVAKGKVDFGQRFNLSMEVRRTTFFENRLDFARGENGVVDTLQTVRKVGEEHESTWQRYLKFDLRSQPFRRVALNSGATRTYSESDYSFSREGHALKGNDQFYAESILRYAEAGSLKVRYSWSENYTDRRPLGSREFRGEEARVSKQADAQFKHRLTDLIDVHLDLQQRLNQIINEDPDNLTDSDRLVTRADMKVLAEPWEWFRAEVAGSYSLEEQINVDAERVNGNQTSDLYEVRGNFIADPDGGWRFVQNYRIQIRTIDRVGGIVEDRFNKQGQWDNRVAYRFANGVTTDAQYLVDYRRSGKRDATRPQEEVYVYGGARRDHRLNVGARVPIGAIDIEARTERGFLRDSSGTKELSEDRGKVVFGVRGNWQVWGDRGNLTVDGSRVLQYGPRVREETREFWIMNTSLRVAF